MTDKLMSLSEAVSECVRPGNGVVLGACLEPNIPFAVTYEIIRQGLSGLNVIAPISDASTDMLIGAGCASLTVATDSANRQHYELPAEFDPEVHQFVQDL